MKIRKSFRLALNMLMHSKLRSWLTIIGIMIGIAAVVSIVSISEGAKQNLEERLSGFGADIITISPGFSRAAGARGGFEGPSGGGFGGRTVATSAERKNLTAKDVMAVKGVPNVKYAMGSVSGRGELAYSSKKTTLSVQGVDAAVWKDITTETLASGRMLQEGDSFSVVIGSNIDDMFENGIPLNSKVTIEGKSFKVVGKLVEGSSIYMPMSIARATISTIGEEEMNSITVKIKDSALSDATVTDITKRLMLSRGILKDKDVDFSVRSQKAMLQNMEATMGTMTIFLGAIAVISLIVGAIGIANTMFTAVLEKTKQIGIMKAIGTKNHDILLMFLLNSGLIGLIGGLGGITLGVFGSNFISYLGSNGTGGGQMRFLSNTMVSMKLLLFSLGFAVIIGMIAGVIPALRASKLKPVDALREE